MNVCDKNDCWLQKKIWRPGHLMMITLARVTSDPSVLVYSRPVPSHGRDPDLSLFHDNVVLRISKSRIQVYAIHPPHFYPSNRETVLSTPHPALEAEAATISKLQSSLFYTHEPYRACYIPHTHRTAIAHITILQSTWGTKKSFGPQHASKQVAKCRSSSHEQYVQSLTREMARPYRHSNCIRASLFG